MTQHRQHLAALIATVLIAAAAPIAAHAAPDEATALVGYFGNTVVITIGKDYRQIRYVDPDHSYRERGSDGEIKGTWDYDGARVCTLQTEPVDLVSKYCNMGLGHKVGDTWTVSDPLTANQVTFQLIAGRN